MTAFTSRTLVPAAALTVALLVSACGRDNPDALVASAQDYLNRNDAPAAIIQLKNALQSRPDDAKVRLLLGQALQETGDVQGAETEFRKAQDLGIPPAEVVPQLAQALLKSRQYSKITSDYAGQQLANEQAQASLKTTLAIAWQRQGDDGKARDSLDEALKAKADYAPALMEQARSKVRSGDVDGALAGLDKIPRQSPSAAELLVDTSFSMVMENRWLPMKRTALALNHLISTRFRSDALQIIAFGRYARTVTPAELMGLEGVYEQGTNLHHALALAARHLRRHPGAQPVVLVVTDGEPTAHLEDFEGGGAGGPVVFFDYPPHPRTIACTVKGFDDVARLGAQVTIFRLGSDPGLARFIDQVARRVQGRVVKPGADGLGAAVVGDYLRSRRR